jgi:hypothetical protein
MDAIESAKPTNLLEDGIQLRYKGRMGAAAWMRFYDLIVHDVRQEVKQAGLEYVIWAVRSWQN